MMTLSQVRKHILSLAQLGERDEERLRREAMKLLRANHLLEDVAAEWVQHLVTDCIADATKPAGLSPRAPRIAAGQQTFAWAELPAEQGIAAARAYVNRYRRISDRSQLLNRILAIVEPWAAENALAASTMTFGEVAVAAGCVVTDVEALSA